MYLGYQNGKIKFYTEQQLDKEFYNLDKVEETSLEYVLNGKEYVLKDEAWEEKQLNIAKTNKYNEINNGARIYLESGEALFEIAEGKHIEATDGNIAKLSAYALSFMTGVQSEVYWNTKEDETIALNQEQLTQALMGLGEVQATVWNVKFPYYLKQLENATTVEEVNAINVDYSLPIPEKEEVTENNNTEQAYDTSSNDPVGLDEVTDDNN